MHEIGMSYPVLASDAESYMYYVSTSKTKKLVSTQGDLHCLGTHSSNLLKALNINNIQTVILVS